MTKRLEIIAKLAAAWVVALLLWRPGRKERAARKLGQVRRILLVRIDNRVGEALLTTPLFRAAKSLPGPPVVDVLVHPKAVRVLKGHPEVDEVIGFDPKERLLGPFSKAIRDLRRRGYDVVVNCASWEAPSVGPAIVSRLIASEAALVGPDVSPIRRLQDVCVSPLPSTRSESLQRLHFLSVLGARTGDPRLSFRPCALDDVTRQTLEQRLSNRAYAVINPGGRLGYRRVPPEVFAAAARVLLEANVVPLVTWGPGEEALAEEVHRAAPGSVLAPPTSIDQLAALMWKARMTVCNNTGPMHLSVAVGTPTLALFYRMEMARWGHSFAPHRMVDLTGAASAIDEVQAVTRAFLTTLPGAASEAGVS